MDYQEYKEDFLNTLRADSAHSGTDTEEEFLNYTLGLLEDFDEIDSPEMTGMGDKKGKGGRLMRADGYCFDESEHSLILFIRDFQDMKEPEKLTRSRVDELYWRLYYFIDEVCTTAPWRRSARPTTALTAATAFPVAPRAYKYRVNSKELRGM